MKVMMTSIDFIIMAAGNSRRFGKNKLLYPIKGRPMFCFVLDQVEKAAEKLSALKPEAEKQPIPAQDGYFCRVFVAARDEEILQEVNRRQKNRQYRGFEKLKNIHLRPAVYSPESVQGVSFTIKNGLHAAGENSDYYIFLTADQPCLQADSIVKLVLETQKAGKGIGSMCWEDTPGNPVIFHRKYVPQLLALEGDTGGRRIVKKNPMDCCFCQVEKKEELADADTVESLHLLLDYFE